MPLWITAAGGPETFIEAGKIGANVLTHLLGQTIETLAEKIALYRNTLRQHGHDARQRTVTLMLHTFVWESTEKALEISKKPFCAYLKSHISLENMAKSVGRTELTHSEEEVHVIVEAAFERYTRTASLLIGSVDDCLQVIKVLKNHGVDEIACFIDFGISDQQVLEGLSYLGELNIRSQNIINFDTNEMTNHLKKYLPDYMLPNGYMTHEKFPLTFNGKIDRKQLEQDSKTVLKSNAPRQAPRSPVEHALVKIWQELLGVKIVSVHDNFFALGGHSLLATQALSRIRKEFNVELPLRTLFTAPTLLEFANEIEKAVKTSVPLTAGIQSVVRGKNYPLSFGQKRLWFLNQLEPDKALHNTLFAKRIQGDLEVEILQRAFVAIMTRHEILRTVITTIENHPYQTILEKSTFQLEKLDWLSYPMIERKEMLEKMIDQQVAMPFDLEQGPLMRALAIQFDSKETILLVIHHHIIFDEWSRHIFLRELAHFYNSYLLEKPHHLPVLEFQYLDFSEWQRHWLQNEVVQKQFFYWKNHLNTSVEPVQLPVDKKRPSALTHEGGTYYYLLEKQLLNKLKHYANEMMD